MTDKTHYRKAFKSPYLSSADITEPTTLTIARVVLEKDQTKKTPDSFNTAYFVEKEIRPGEKLKPMILNVGNSEAVRDMCGSKFIDDWHGSVTVFVDSNVKFGRDTVEGLRIRPGPAFISESEAANIEALIEEVGADRAGLLNWAKADTVERIPANKYADTIRALQAKRSK